jgi:hypothetical protein
LGGLAAIKTESTLFAGQLSFGSCIILCFNYVSLVGRFFTKQSPLPYYRMKIALILCCLIALAQKASAQAAGHDSTVKADTVKTLSRSERMRQMMARRAGMMQPAPAYSGAPAKAARRDARRIRLPKDMVVKLRAGEIPASSDYFKPTAATASNPALLTDSAYIKSYRYYAFNSAQRKIIHPVGTGLIIGGSVLVFSALMLALITAFSHEKG